MDMVKGTDKLVGCGIDGITLEDGRQIAMAFFEWYIGYIREHQPYAVNSINALEAGMNEIPMDINDIN